MRGSPTRRRVCGFVAGGLLAGLLGVGGGIVIVPALYFALSLTSMLPTKVRWLSRVR